MNYTKQDLKKEIKKFTQVAMLLEERLNKLYAMKQLDMFEINITTAKLAEVTRKLEVLIMQLDIIYTRA